jgi:hypothetical protein
MGLLVHFIAMYSGVLGFICGVLATKGGY